MLRFDAHMLSPFFCAMLSHNGRCLLIQFFCFLFFCYCYGFWKLLAAVTQSSDSGGKRSFPRTANEQINQVLLRPKKRREGEGWKELDCPPQPYLLLCFSSLQGRPQGSLMFPISPLLFLQNTHWLLGKRTNPFPCK